jgi:glutamate synthase domain-containing protein 1
MDDVTTPTNKSKEDEINVEESLQKIKTIDVSIFNETLREIEQILNTLDQKLEVEKGQLEKLNVYSEIKSTISKFHLAKNELVKEEDDLIKNNNLIKRIENLEKTIDNSNKSFSLSSEVKEEALNEIEEHKIDKSLLSTEDLNDFERKNESRNKKSFNFYSYLILIIIIFFTFYGTLNISKDLIIYKYPMTEPYIQYFYEIIEILKFSILGVADFIKNKI